MILMKIKKFRIYILFILCLLVVVFISSSTLAQGPSFNCAKASTRIEEMVCADVELSKLDLELSTIYSKLLNNLNKTDRKELIRRQREWIKNSANKCSENEDEILKNCIKEFYLSRIENLSKLYSYHESQKPVKLVFARKKPVCTCLLKKLNSDISRYGNIQYTKHPEFKTDNWVKIGQPKGDDPISQEVYRCYYDEIMEIDINNDNAKDLILRHTACLSGVPSHSFFIYKLKNKSDTINYQKTKPLFSIDRTGDFLDFEVFIEDKKKSLKVSLGGMFTINPFNHMGVNYILISDKTKYKETIGKWILLTEITGDFENKVQCVFENNYK